MNFNQHYALTGKHALLGASQHAWLNYTPEKMQTTYFNMLKKEKGTELHALASSCIVNRIKVASLKKALNLFINDAIGFRMDSEVVLYYSDNCFGTADAIKFEDGELRIHDLKTGERPVTNFGQLDIYAALFCLEYSVDPKQISIVERLYQGREWHESQPDAVDIASIMEKIKEFDALVDELKQQ